MNTRNRKVVLYYGFSSNKKDSGDCISRTKSSWEVKELFTLNMLHKTDVSEFVICPHQRETIYLNKSFERAEDLIPIINGFMEQEWCNSKGDKLYKQFEDIAGEKAVSILSAIWQDWRKERMKLMLKKKPMKY